MKDATPPTWVRSPQCKIMSGFEVEALEAHAFVIGSSAVRLCVSVRTSQSSYDHILVEYLVDQRG